MNKPKGERKKKRIESVNLDLIDLCEDNEKIFDCGNLDSLVESIKRNGFQGTVEVYEKNDGRYELLSGHRRYLSAKTIGMKTIPCEIVMEPSESQKAEILIMSNIATRELTPIEKGKALAYYEEKVLKKDKSVKGDRRAELAKRFGIASSQVYKYKALLNLIPEIQKLIVDEKVAYVNIYACAVLPIETQKNIYDEICNYLSERESISGREVVQIVDAYLKPKRKEGSSAKEPKPDTFTNIPEEAGMVEPISFSQMNRYHTGNNGISQLVEVEKNKTKKPMLYNEQRVFITSQTLRPLLIQMTKKEKPKLSSREVIDELLSLRELLNSIFE